MPSTHYSQPIKTADMEANLERGLAHFVGNYLLKPENLERYQSKYDSADGVNSALYNDLIESLMKHEHFLTQIPLRPDDEFKFGNQKTTPRKYLKETVKFNSDDFKAVIVTPQTQDLALRAIVESIRDHKMPAVVGINIFGDDAEWVQETDQGLFSEAICKECDVVTGGHELMIVNYLFGDDPNVPIALIVQNSWGRRGHRDINGNITKDITKSGYYILTRKYIEKGEKQSNWDLILAKSVLLSKKIYQKLQAE